jgi:hypothetical protein
VVSDSLPDLKIASHTLGLLRGIDQRQRQMMELILRQQDLINRLERDLRDGFALIDRDLRDGLSRSDRDLKEIKSDIVLLESRISQEIADLRDREQRLDDHEEWLSRLETGSANGPSNGSAL